MQAVFEEDSRLVGLNGNNLLLESFHSLYSGFQKGPN